MNETKNETNILTYFQDDSITNILKFILDEHHIQLIKYDKHIKSKISNIKVIILDNDIDEAEKNAFYEFIESYHPKTPILLTIGSNYKKAFQTVYSNNILGMIYKPFDVEEVIAILKEDLNLIHA